MSSFSQPFPPTALRRRHAQTVRYSTSSYKIDYVIVIKNFLNLKGPHNLISGSKVTAILLKGWVLPIGGASAGEGLSCSPRSRLVSFPPWCVQQGQGHIGQYWLPLWLCHRPGISFCFSMDTSLFSIQQTASLSLYRWFWTLPATPSSQVVLSFPAFITGIFSFCPNAFQPYL